MNFSLFVPLVVLAGLLLPSAALLYVQLALCLFGATAAIGLPALGGASISPAVLFLPFLVLRAARERGLGRFLSELPRAGVWLLLLTCWGLLSAALLPRWFAGETQILTVDRGSADLRVMLYQLRPVSGNMTQAGYLLGSLLTFLAGRSLLRNREQLLAARDAVLLLAGLNVAAALLNLAEYYLGVPSLLPYLRTAGYSVFEAYEEAGLVRIQGTFAETSAFSAFTLPLFAFATNCWLYGVRPRLSGLLALASLSLLLVSTSGTAYAGLLSYLAVLGGGLVWAWLAGRGVPRRGELLALAGVVGVIACCALLFEPRFVHRIGDFFELTLLNKLQSSSGVERSSWNQQALQNFLDTGGVGVGLGSARASSFPLVLLSNLGILGVVFFLGFLREVFRRREGRYEPDATTRAGRHAAIATLVGSAISGTVFDLGIAFYLFAAVASAGVVSSFATERPRRAALAQRDAPASL